jgi:uncharacterized protein YrrD
MLRSVKELRGYFVHATDGRVGRVDDFLFNDQTWTIRYLVVKTGQWLRRQCVLITPIVLGALKQETRSLSVGLSRRQVEDRPVSHQMQKESRWWPPWTGVSAKATAKRGESTTEKRRGDPKLRTVREVINYGVQANDGQVGRVADMIVDDEPWVIRYIVIDTRHVLSGKKVLVASTWVRSVTWPERCVCVDLATETVKHGPEFDPAAPANRAYETGLYDGYDRSKQGTPLQVERAGR